MKVINHTINIGITQEEVKSLDVVIKLLDEFTNIVPSCASPLTRYYDWGVQSLEFLEGIRQNKFSDFLFTQIPE